MRHYSKIVSTLALFVGLGGTSYAVTALPRNSVGTVQIKAHAVTAAKLAPDVHTLGSQGPAGPMGHEGAPGVAGPRGPQGERGVEGAKGLTGDAGALGAPGTPGAPGAPGAPGTNGVDGAPGPPGPTGTAKAWAVIDSFGNVVSSSGDVAVVVEGQGIYCVSTTASYNLLLATASNDAGHQTPAFATIVRGGCDGGSEVKLWAPAGGGSSLTGSGVTVTFV